LSKPLRPFFSNKEVFRDTLLDKNDEVLGVIECGGSSLFVSIRNGSELCFGALYVLLPKQHLIIQPA
jgi:hypothetical protein